MTITNFRAFRASRREATIDEVAQAVGYERHMIACDNPLRQWLYAPINGVTLYILETADGFQWNVEPIGDDVEPTLALAERNLWANRDYFGAKEPRPSGSISPAMKAAAEKRRKHPRD